MVHESVLRRDVRGLMAFAERFLREREPAAELIGVRRETVRRLNMRSA